MKKMFKKLFFKKEIDDSNKDIEYQQSGKIKDVISTFFNQFDKKIHNAIFTDKNKSGEDSAFRNKLWEFHENAFKKRYRDLDSFVKRNTILVTSLTVAGICFGQGGLSLMENFLYGASSLLMLDTTIKATVTKYNLYKYGRSPKLEKNKKILDGSYKENLKKAMLAYNNSKRLSVNNEEVQHVEKIVSDRMSDEEINIRFNN